MCTAVEETNIEAIFAVMTSDLTSLVPLQFSPWLQVRKIGTIHLSIYLSIYLMNTTELVVEIRAGKNSGPYGI